MKAVFPGVYARRGRYFTRSLGGAEPVYGERVLSTREGLFREWSPFRSKLAAALKKGLKAFPFLPGDGVLYLGAAEGTTASHLADIVGGEGVVVGVDVAPEPMKKFLEVCERWPNLVPVLADARAPETYRGVVEEAGVNALYQDVAVRDQAEVFSRNAQAFLKKGQQGVLVVKAHSVSSTRPARAVFQETLRALAGGFSLQARVPLQPFERYHELLVMEKQ